MPPPPAPPHWMRARVDRAPPKRTSKPPADPHQRIADVVKLLCEAASGGPAESDDDLLVALKRAVRRDDDAMRRAHASLMLALKHKECSHRTRAVTIIDALFVRSHLFRCLAVDDLSSFLRHAIGVDNTDAKPLPPWPVAETEKLREISAKALDAWTTRFASAHPRLVVASAFARDALGADAPDAVAAARRAVADERARRTEEGVLKRWRAFEREELPELRRDVGECVVAIDACVGMLLGAEGGTGGGSEEEEDDDDEDWEDVEGAPCPAATTAKREPAPPAIVAAVPTIASSSRHSTSSIQITETEDNAVVMRELIALCRAGASRLAPSLSAALALLARVKPSTAAAARVSGTRTGTGIDAEEGIASEERASWVNTLAAAKRKLTRALARCAALGVPGAADASRDDLGDVNRREMRTDAADDDAEGEDEDEDEDEEGSVTIRVPRLPEASDGVPVGGAGGGKDGDDDVLDALLARVAARRKKYAGRGKGGGHGGGAAGANANANANGGGGGRGGAGGAGGANSVKNRAKKMLAATMAKHNADVLAELGAAGQDRREFVSGAAGVYARRRAEEASEAAAIALAREEAKEAKRRREAPTPKQRIEARLKELKRRRR